MSALYKRLLDQRALLINEYNKRRHIGSIRARQNQVDRVEQSSRGYTRVYEFDPLDQGLKKSPDSFLSAFVNSNDVQTVVYNAVNTCQSIKMYCTLVTNYEMGDPPDIENRIFSEQTDPVELYLSDPNIESTIHNELVNQTRQLKKDDKLKERSGFRFANIETLQVRLVKINQSIGVPGGCTLDTPEFLSRSIQGQSQLIYNVKSTNIDDHKCFIYAILALLYPTKNLIKYGYDLACNLYDKTKILYWGMLDFPLRPKDKQIDKFEEMNEISINIFGLLYDKNGDKLQVKVLPIRLTPVSKTLHWFHANLLFLTSPEQYEYGHYVGISDLRKLHARLYKINNGGEKIAHVPYICNYCVQTFERKTSYLNHEQLDCQRKGYVLREFPPANGKDNILQFNNIKHKQFLPYILYYDTECYFQRYTPKDDTKTELSKQMEHKLYSYCILLDCCYNPKLSKIIINDKTTTPDIEHQMIEDIMSLYKRANASIKRTQKDPKKFDQDPNAISRHNSIINCEYCGVLFDEVNPNNKKVLHHNHFNGQYIATLCNRCNILISDTKLPIPIVAHNASRYDQHMLMKALVDYVVEQNELNKYNKSDANNKIFDIIPDSDEVYKTITYYNLRFIDSLAFVIGSLENLTKDLKITAENTNNRKELFRYIYKEYGKVFTDDEIDQYLLQKNYFPYEYMDSLDKFKEKIEYVAMDDYKSSLKGGKGITIDEYQHVMDICRKIPFKDIREYNLFYLKIDVLILQAVFDNFRHNIWNEFKIDPCFYISLPSLSMDLFLQTSKAKIELITDSEIYDFVLKGMYGGLSYIGQRYEEANNKYMSNYDAKKPSKYILYQDYNSLYPSVMSSCRLPVGDFHWIEHDTPEEMMEEMNNIISSNDYYDNQPIKSGKGYLLEVDIEIPEDLHDKFREYPLFPERKQITGDQLSDIQKERAVALGLATGDGKDYKSQTKLITDLTPKENYVIHFQCLKLALQEGCKVTKVHKILEWTEDYYMKSYIDHMVSLRVKAKESGQTSLAETIKRCMNSLYGKTCERVENRCHIKIVTDEEQMIKEASNPWFKEFTTINDDYRIVHYYPSSYYISKPVQIGMCILALSKLKMQRYWYEQLYPYYKNKLTLCMTDTDSLLYSVETDDIFNDLANGICKNWIDGSNLNIKELEKYDIEGKNCRPGTLNKLKFEEQNGKNLYTITRFVGLKAKCYAYEKEKYIDKTKKYDNRCKGVMKEVSKTMNFDLYKNFVDGERDKAIYDIYHIRSFNQSMFTCKESKIGLSFLDDKRYFINNYVTVPYGYRYIP